MELLKQLSEVLRREIFGVTPGGTLRASLGVTTEEIFKVTLGEIPRGTPTREIYVPTTIGILRKTNVEKLLEKLLDKV